MVEQNRVCCLYRVSTDKQVDFGENHEADIPMQRKACRSFAEKMGWSIVHEEREDGISGHKVRAEKRDKIQVIKELARRGEFDILLVFMFDRIGRIADETPFVVEWFVKNGIRVWSTQEGEQRFDNHIDKLLNYIRFWQADGESEKTSIRTKTSLRQMVEEGHYKGGPYAYGYKLVKSGRINKRKHELYDLEINENEAPVVRLIFDKYTNEGFGTWRIANFLNESGYRTRQGGRWVQASVRTILCNPTYSGILRCGDTHSPILPELQIITSDQFETAQEIIRSRKKPKGPRAALNTRGQSLLAGNVFCGHCGARLNLTTNGRYRRRSDGSVDKELRIRYVCYGKTRKRTECDGQTGYTMTKLDGIVDKLIKQIFSKMKDVPKSAVLTARCNLEYEEKEKRLGTLRLELTEAQRRLALLKGEIIRCLEGKSDFKSDLLSSLIAEAEAEAIDHEAMVRKAETELTKQEESRERMNKRYDELVSWSELYDNASIEQRKMIINNMVKRIDVFNGYELKVEFDFDLCQFFEGLDYYVTTKKCRT